MHDLTTAQRLSAYHDELIEAGFNPETACEMVSRATPPVWDIRLQCDLDAEPEPPSTEAVFFGKKVNLAWPEGLPLGFSQQALAEKMDEFGHTLLDGTGRGDA